MSQQTPDRQSAANAPASPTPFKALLFFAMNVVILPGLGTLIGGGESRRRAGKIQMLLGILALPLFILSAGAGGILLGFEAEKVQRVLNVLIYLLFAWTFISGIGMVREAFRARASANRRDASRQ